MGDVGSFVSLFIFLSHQYHLPELQGPDSVIYASLRQAEFSEITEKTLFFSDFLYRIFV